eukprot:TRINITY_DN4981_c0_g1_i1.p1 TRINITY_DN4981_c0_g1~~TRINITY_DN4981_c0_g1_i1.p1  ORF type:complete len:109 (-),score=15.32 TRINITY_DN4981_c0_g1_i1:343-669(-)
MAETFGFLHPGLATISFFGAIISAILILCIFLWMRFCYYPGGLKRTQVMDIADYPRWREEQLQKQQLGDEESDGYTSEEALHHEEDLKGFRGQEPSPDQDIESLGVRR